MGGGQSEGHTIWWQCIFTAPPKKKFKKKKSMYFPWFQKMGVQLPSAICFSNKGVCTNTGSNHSLGSCSSFGKPLVAYNLHKRTQYIISAFCNRIRVLLPMSLWRWSDDKGLIMYLVRPNCYCCPGYSFYWRQFCLVKTLAFLTNNRPTCIWKNGQNDLYTTSGFT